jgi:lysophospholipase L1-like esterase
MRQPFIQRAIVTAGIVVLSAMTAVACTSASAGHDVVRPSGSVVAPGAGPGSAARQGSSNKLFVVGLGDSVMAGTACPCAPFIARYAAALGSRRGVSAGVVNLGRSGLTAPGLAAQVKTASVASSLRSASVVVVTIGANDLAPLVSQWRHGTCPDECIATGTAQLKGALGSVLGLVRADVPPEATILVTTYWNVFEDGDVADGDYGPYFAAWSDSVTAKANAQICAAAREVDATCVDLYRPFNGNGGQDPTPLLADDGDHPNAAGHTLIARVLLAATL